MLRENKLGISANLILAMLMSSSICQTLYTSLFMTYKLSLTIFIAVVPLTVIFFVMFKSKVSTIVSSIGLCLIIIIGLIFIIFNIGITNAGNWLSDYSIWFIDVTNGFNDVSSQLYTTLTLLSIAFIITLFVYIFSIKFYNFYIISVMLFSVFFVQLQFSIFISNISFILFIFSFLLYYFFDILRRRSKEPTYDVGNKLKYLICIIPICVVIIIVSLSFPIKSDRNAFPWLDKKFDSAIESIINYFSNKDLSNFDYFSIKATGFGSKDRLGGNIKLSKTHVMDVKSEYSNLYLKATSKAFYDGHNWYDDNKQLIPLGKDIKVYSDTINLDSNEFVNGSYMVTGSSSNDSIYNSAKVEIKFVNLNTKSLFIPLKSNKFTFKNPINLFFDNEQMISASEIRNKGFEYTIAYNNLMLNSDEFKANIRKSYKGFYNDYYNDHKPSDTEADVTIILSENGLMDFNVNKSLSIFLNQNQKSSYLSEALKDKVDIIYRKYTQLPEIVTPRVHQLAQDLTKDKSNAYDKTKAIESYLSNNFLYTLSPGNPPRKKDFVDYFLFEGKEGYCTYYATAMTVLLRCIDIPARYVEGYILPPETDEKGVFKVTNQQAHAWVEVYFEGFGWIPFEPTSPFVANMYNDRTISAKVSSSMLDSGYIDYMEMMNKYRDINAGISYASGDLTSASESKTNIPLLVLIIISSVIGFILLAFVILVLINIFRFYCTLRRIRKGNPNSSVLMAYNYIIKVLGIQNIVFQPGETPSQFGIRVEKTFDFMSYSFSKTSFTKITSHYIKARYSKAALLKNDQQDMLDFIDILLNLTLEKMGKLKFVLTRYVFGKI
ncbi:MAG: transglutaminase-like domain-containing protein [Ruminiclostridium sp.]